MRKRLTTWATALIVGSATAQAMAADKLDITPEEHAACDSDAQRLCFSAYPDEDKMVACMRANRPQLTRQCRATFNAGLKRRHLPM